MADGMHKHWREDGGTILQFGAGNFLRGFVDLFVEEINARGDHPPFKVVVVQSTEGGRAALLNERGGCYRVVVRGAADGALVERVQEVGCIERAYVAQTEWPAVRDVARSPWLMAITSNTTEAGLSLDPADDGWREWSDTPPRSFPARLLALLYLRHRAGRQGVTVLPCELVENNADRLRGLALEQAARWGWDRDAGFVGWLTGSCTWANTLVDRIVSGKPEDHPLLADDPLLTVAEPYAFWAVEDKTGTEFLGGHPAIHRVADVAPYSLRKVRILNGAHTALVERVRRTGRDDIRLVREAVADPDLGGWLRGLLFEEIVPTVADRAPDAEGFARQTLERFANPFLDHKLSDIALHHDKKVPVRLVPTFEEFKAKFGREPARLAGVL
jgi:tagaturonate reductase